VCSTVLGDKVCRGCKRYNHEIVAWNGYSEEQKLAVERRLDALLGQIVESKLRILDAPKLLDKLRQYGIRSRSPHNPACWVFELLRAGAGQITEPVQFGFEPLPEWRETGLVELRDSIDREFYLLSAAHYERYIAGG